MEPPPPAPLQPIPSNEHAIPKKIEDSIQNTQLQKMVQELYMAQGQVKLISMLKSLTKTNTLSPGPARSLGNTACPNHCLGRSTQSRRILEQCSRNNSRSSCCPRDGSQRRPTRSNRPTSAGCPRSTPVHCPTKGRRTFGPNGGPPS